MKCRECSSSRLRRSRLRLKDLQRLLLFQYRSEVDGAIGANMVARAAEDPGRFDLVILSANA
jgi:hypothetical protein